MWYNGEALSPSKENPGVAGPATASSAPGRTRRSGPVPPWIEERRLREQQLREQAAVLGFPIPLRPNTREYRRILDAAIQRFRAAQEKAKANSDGSEVPF